MYFYKFLFVVSVAAGVLSDYTFKHYVGNIGDGFLLFLLNLINLIVVSVLVYIFRGKKYKFNLMTVFRAMVTLIGYLCFCALFKKSNFTIEDATSAYYIIPIADILLTILLTNDRVRWTNIIFFGFSVMFVGLHKQCIEGIFGAFCFALADLYMRLFTNNWIDESFTYHASIMLCCLPFYKQFDYSSLQGNWNVILLMSVCNLAIQAILLFCFRKYATVHFLPFRLFDLIITTIIEKNYLKTIVVTTSVAILSFFC